LFEVAPPERTRRYLVVGQTVTEWELPLYDASETPTRFFTSTSLAGRPAVVLFHDLEDCRQTPCFSIADFSAVVASNRARIGSVIIAQGEYPETSVQQALRAGTPMVSDDGSVAPVWLAEPGTVAFIDANGNVHSLLSPNRGTTRELLSDSIDRFVDDGAFATARPSSEDAP
jgi:hypothetical protein